MSAITNVFHATRLASGTDADWIGYRLRHATPEVIEQHMARGRRIFGRGEARIMCDSEYELVGYDEAAAKFEAEAEARATQAAALQRLVERAEATFPSLAYRNGGSRAEVAAQLVLEERVSYLGLEAGFDWWQVSTYRTTIKGGRCTCQDQAAPSDKAGRLCKHRLAAMFAFKLNPAQVQKEA